MAVVGIDFGALPLSLSLPAPLHPHRHALLLWSPPHASLPPLADEFRAATTRPTAALAAHCASSPCVTTASPPPGNLNCVIAQAGRGGVDVLLNGASKRQVRPYSIRTHAHACLADHPGASSSCAVVRAVAPNSAGRVARVQPSDGSRASGLVAGCAQPNQPANRGARRLALRRRSTCPCKEISRRRPRGTVGSVASQAASYGLVGAVPDAGGAGVGRAGVGATLA